MMGWPMSRGEAESVRHCSDRAQFLPSASFNLPSAPPSSSITCWITSRSTTLQRRGKGTKGGQQTMTEKKARKSPTLRSLRLSCFPAFSSLQLSACVCVCVCVEGSAPPFARLSLSLASHTLSSASLHPWSPFSFLLVRGRRSLFPTQRRAWHIVPHNRFSLLFAMPLPSSASLHQT